MIRIFGHYFLLRAVLIAVFEFAAISAIYKLATLITVKMALGEGSYHLFGDQVFPKLAGLTIWLTAAACGLYNAETIADTRNLAGRLLAVSILSYFLTAVLVSVTELLFFQTENLKLYYAINLGACVGYGLVALLLRINVFARQIPGTVLERRILILGGGDLARKAADLGSRASSPYRVVGVVAVNEGAPLAGVSCDVLVRKEVLDTPTGLLELVREKRVDEVVFASRERRGMPSLALMACKLGGIVVSNFPDFWERQAGQVDLDSLNPGWMIFSEGFNVSRGGLACKRAFDLLVGSLLLIATAPICIVTAVAIRLEDSGPLFYRQTRVGQNNCLFEIIKFRSMRTDAEKDGVAIWAGANDARVTRVGRFIRRTRIDEIPQVWNVLLGQMSFVGPRPERPVFVQALSQKIPYYDVRHLLKPGITGWAQIRYPYGASDEDAKAKLAFDLYYVKNWNIFLDLVILFQTVRVVLWREGSR